MIWANYPSEEEIERAINEAFEVTGAEDMIREANKLSELRCLSPESKKLIEYDALGVPLSEQANRLGKTTSWINHSRRRLGMKDLRADA